MSAAQEALLEHFATRPGPYSGAGPEELAGALGTEDPCPEDGADLEEVLRGVGESVLARSLRVYHPACAAHLHCPPLTAALAAEAMISATNQSMDSWDQSPAATFLEQRMVDWLCGLFGLSAAGDGVFTSGGTQSNFMGLLLARGRLYRFYFLERFHVLRREYNHYCRWVSEKLESCRFGEHVEEIRWTGPGADGHFEVRAREAGDERTYRARHLALGVGSTPHIPECLEGLPEEDVFHSAEFLSRKKRCARARSITVIGSGQSAAEVFHYLLKEQEEHGYGLDWLTRSRGFFPMEYSKLGLEHFSPEYVRYFHGLLASSFARLRLNRNRVLDYGYADDGERPHASEFGQVTNALHRVGLSQAAKPGRKEHQP